MPLLHSLMCLLVIVGTSADFCGFCRCFGDLGILSCEGITKDQVEYSTSKGDYSWVETAVFRNIKGVIDIDNVITKLKHLRVIDILDTVLSSCPRKIKVVPTCATLKQDNNVSIHIVPVHVNGRQDGNQGHNRDGEPDRDQDQNQRRYNILSAFSISLGFVSSTLSIYCSLKIFKRRKGISFFVYIKRRCLNQGYEDVLTYSELMEQYRSLQKSMSRLNNEMRASNDDCYDDEFHHKVSRTRIRSRSAPPELVPRKKPPKPARPPTSPKMDTIQEEGDNSLHVRPSTSSQMNSIQEEGDNSLHVGPSTSLQMQVIPEQDEQVDNDNNDDNYDQDEIDMNSDDSSSIGSDRSLPDLEFKFLDGVNIIPPTPPRPPKSKSKNNSDCLD